MNENDKEEPSGKPAGDEDQESRREPSDTTMTPQASSSSNSEERTETQEATSVKERLTAKSSTEKAHSHVCRRTCQTKTGKKKKTKNGDVRTPAVNTLLSDETRALETNICTDDSKQANTLTVLDDPGDVKKERQKELNSVRDMGVVRKTVA